MQIIERESFRFVTKTKCWYEFVECTKTTPHTSTSL
jgi:hypothetical protein